MINDVTSTAVCDAIMALAANVRSALGGAFDVQAMEAALALQLVFYRDEKVSRAFYRSMSEVMILGADGRVYESDFSADNLDRLCIDVLNHLGHVGADLFEQQVQHMIEVVRVDEAYWEHRRVTSRVDPPEQLLVMESTIEIESWHTDDYLTSKAGSPPMVHVFEDEDATGVVSYNTSCDLVFALVPRGQNPAEWNLSPYKLYLSTGEEAVPKRDAAGIVSWVIKRGQGYDVMHERKGTIRAFEVLPC